MLKIKAKFKDPDLSDYKRVKLNQEEYYNIKRFLLCRRLAIKNGNLMKIYSVKWFTLRITYVKIIGYRANVIFPHAKKIVEFRIPDWTLFDDYCSFKNYIK